MPRIDQTNNSPARIRRSAANIVRNTEEEDTIDLVGLFFRLLENLKYIILTAALCAIIAGVVTIFLITPQYQATSKIYVLSSSDSAINLADIQIGTALTSDYQEVFKNWLVHEKVIQILDLPYSYSELSDMLSISNPSNTRILYITVTSSDALEAKTIADTYAKVVQEFVASTFDTKEPNLFEEALLPSVSFSPSKTKNTALGFLVGLFLSSFVVTVKFITGDKIRSSDDIERITGLPTLGAIPLQEHIPRGKTKDKQNRSKKSRKAV